MDRALGTLEDISKIDTVEVPANGAAPQATTSCTKSENATALDFESQLD